MSTNNTDNREAQLTGIARTVVAILGVPLALFTVVNNIFGQPPHISLIVALFTTVLVSIWVILSHWVTITQIIIAWLALAVVVLTGFVIWPRTMTVEGYVRDAAGNPVSREEVVCLDKGGQRYETTTDAEGHYQFTGVPTGKYKLRVRGNEIEGETKGFLVRVVQQNLTVSEVAPTASPARVAAVTPNTPTAVPMLTSTCTVTVPTVPETLFTLIDTEAQAVLDEDIDLIKTIFAPDAIIQNAATSEEWSSPEIYYAEKFRNEIHCQIEHYDYNVLKLTDTVALVTTASRGNWGWETKGCTETYDSPPDADQWHFRRDAFSHWRIVRLTYNTHTQQP